MILGTKIQNGELHKVVFRNWKDTIALYLTCIDIDSSNFNISSICKSMFTFIQGSKVVYKKVSDVMSK